MFSCDSCISWFASPRRYGVAAVLALGLVFGGKARAGEPMLESMGARGGFSATSIDDGFYQVEAYATAELPWRLAWGSDWRLQTGLDCSTGMLARGGEQGLVASLGPTVSLQWDEAPLLVVAGCSPTILSRRTYDNVDFGFPVQFTSHLGVTWNVGRRVAFNYRFQHMSNASIKGDNPGLNLHLFSLGFRF